MVALAVVETEAGAPAKVVGVGMAGQGERVLGSGCRLTRGNRNGVITQR